jgi:3',5'-cyclic AMP phosphodiesterase CpdA
LLGAQKEAGVHLPLRFIQVLAAALVAGASLAGAPDHASAKTVVVAAGDIASCPNGRQAATAALVRRIRPTRVLALGDNAYSDGTLAEYRDCYGPSWGRFKRKTSAVPGNHEYNTPRARGFRRYFGFVGRRIYRSFRLGRWRLYALNGERVSRNQVAWLRDRLRKSPSRCVLAYWHHPRFTDGNYAPGDPDVKPLWDALAAAGADVILAGHDHNYQRFGMKDGIRSFVVGTGGTPNFYPVDPRRVKAWKSGVHGVLRIRLLKNEYRWRFRPVAGSSYTDSGRANCGPKLRTAPAREPVVTAVAAALARRRG